MLRSLASVDLPSPGLSSDRGNCASIYHVLTAVACRGLVDLTLLSQPRHELTRCNRLDPSRSDGVYANRFRSYLLCQALAVRRQCCLGGCVCEGRLEEGEPPLYR